MDLAKEKKKMEKRQSKSEKAEREVKRRLEYSVMKRFNDPLKCYVERKYPKIFDEYKNFYEYLNTMNPELKNLTKSKQFKDWEENISTYSPENISSYSPMEPNLKIQLMPLELAKINLRLRKIEVKLKENKTKAATNEVDVITDEVDTNETEAITDEVDTNETEAATN